MSMPHLGDEYGYRTLPICCTTRNAGVHAVAAGSQESAGVEEGQADASWGQLISVKV